MVHVSIKLKNGMVTSFEVKGHAGYAEKGYDIICSAISAISYTAIGYFENKYNPEGKKDKTLYVESDGYIKWRRPRGSSPKEILQDNSVLEAMIIGFKQIEYSYGRKYICVKEEEV